METSDSECFESADEEFDADHVQSKTKTSPKVQNKLTVCSKTDCNEKLVETAVGDATQQLEFPSVVPEQTDIENDLSKTKIEELKAEDEYKRKQDANTNMWDSDDEDWEAIREVKQVEPTSESKETCSDKGWGEWGSWGSTLLSTASSFTQGITTALENGALGAPAPEELARSHRTVEKRDETDTSDGDNSNRNLTFGLGNLVSGVCQITKIVETTGNKVITGGLDTLEIIGKKTMEVLQDGDPGLKKKRAFLKIDQNTTVLSQILREAKEKAEKENTASEKEHLLLRKANYETLFDDHEGLVHLEALEMLSKQCDIKLQTLMEMLEGNSLTEMQETLNEVKELCELTQQDEDEGTLRKEDVKEKLATAVSEMNVAISYDRLLATWEEIEDWLAKLNVNVCSDRELHEQAIDSLAQLTSLAVQQFHKTGELLMLKEHHSTADEADSLVEITTTLKSVVSNVASKFADKLHQIGANAASKDQLGDLITNIYYESANSCTYIEDAFHLLIPVLQHGAV